MKVRTFLVCALCGALAVGVGATAALATIPYGSAGGPFPGFGPAVSPPPVVGGKEYSHDRDSTTIGAGAVGPPPFDAEQIVAWDGVGGTVDVTDYTGSRAIFTPDLDIDAIANSHDFAYKELKSDVSHLVFSVDDVYALYVGGAGAPAFLPSAGPVVLGNGNVIGGAGEFSVEMCTGCGNPADVQTFWAKQPDINGMPFPDDVDGLEVWGPEPPLADADKYSLDVDITSFGVIPGDAVSVWNASGTPYIPHSTIVAAVMSLLPGPIPTDVELHQVINLDALMVQDTIGDEERFDPGPGGPAGGPGPGDEIIFSIRQIPNPADPDGYYATGSELFILNAGAPPVYLTHGGHLWDHTYSLGAFDIWRTDPERRGVIDINAIESIGEFAVPEPCSLLLLALSATVGLGFRRRLD